MSHEIGIIPLFARCDALLLYPESGFLCKWHIIGARADVKYFGNCASQICTVQSWAKNPLYLMMEKRRTLFIEQFESKQRKSNLFVLHFYKGEIT